jgi:hypothetical protein
MFLRYGVAHQQTSSAVRGSMRADRRRQPRPRRDVWHLCEGRSCVEWSNTSGSTDNIVLVLRARFGKALPSPTADRLRKGPQEELDELFCRCAVATTLEGPECPAGQHAVDRGRSGEQSRRKDD